MIRNVKKVGIREIHLNIIKARYNKSTANMLNS